MITKLSDYINKINESSKEEVTIEDIENVLDKSLPKEIIRKVGKYKIMGREMVYIVMYTTEKTINNVKGQHPDIVSLRFDPNDMSLKPQGFGGSGGQSVYREKDPSIEKERFLALGSEKIPFRKPRPNKKAILKAIENFAKRYIKILIDIKERDLISSSNIDLGVNYDFLG